MLKCSQKFIPEFCFFSYKSDKIPKAEDVRLLRKMVVKGDNTPYIPHTY